MYVVCVAYSFILHKNSLLAQYNPQIPLSHTGSNGDPSLRYCRANPKYGAARCKDVTPNSFLPLELGQDCIVFCRFQAISFLFPYNLKQN